MILWCIGGCVCYSIARLAQAKRCKRQLNFPQECIRASFVAYISGIASQLFAPVGRIWMEMEGGYRHINIRLLLRENRCNLIPFRTLWAQLTGNLPLDSEDIYIGRLNILFNLLVFLPLGVFLPVLFRKEQKWYFVSITAVGISALTQVVKYLVGRTADIDDILLNVIGCMIVYAIYKITHYCLRMR